MKKTIAFLAVGLLAQAHADDIQIQMTGNIYANTCIIDSASRNLTVDLGQTVSGSFKDVGDTGEWKDFSLSVSHCPATLALATAFFYGQADSVHPTKFANIGSAKGLALELADRAQGFFLFAGRQLLADLGVVVVRVENTQSRSAFDTDETDRRYGFDVLFRYEREDKRAVPAISKPPITFTKEE